MEAALAEIDRLPGRHLFFLDDHLFGDPRFAAALFDGMRGMGRVWQAAATVQSVLAPHLLEKAASCGLRSLFVGFETLDPGNLRAQHKSHNLLANYERAIRRMHDHGVMVNASFVFGMDEDETSVFERTTAWAIQHGIETATFHILTPYPGTPLYARLKRQGRILTDDWSLYDTRHAVAQPVHMTTQDLERGYRRAYELFYSWPSIVKGAWAHDRAIDGLRHLAYAGGWKKFEALWGMIIKAKQVASARPLLEAVLAGVNRRSHPTGFLSAARARPWPS